MNIVLHDIMKNGDVVQIYSDLWMIMENNVLREMTVQEMLEYD